MDPRSGCGSVAVEIGVLGPLEIRVDAQPRDLPGRRERAVLTMLAVHVGEPVSVARLWSLLWADDPPRTADKSLQTYVSRIRRVLGEESAVVRREAAYVLVLSRSAVDAARFADEVTAARAAVRSGDDAAALRRFRRALAMWRAEEPAAMSETPEGAAVREHLVGTRLAVAIEAAELALRLGNAEVVASEVEGLVVRHPLHEELWALLMEALARSGRQAAALAAFQRARDRFADELGLDPSPRLVDLQRRILSGDPAFAGSRPDATPRPVPDAPAFRRVPAATDPAGLVGRDTDRARVRAALQAGRLATVVGAGGVGKTALALDVARSTEEPAVLCELAPVHDPAAVVHAVATALGVEQSSGQDAESALAAAVGSASLLLVIDNCEHLLASVRHTVHVMLGRCPRLRILATSRQPLGVAGEVVVTLAPLSTGGPGAAADRLFVDRAARVGVALADDAATRALVRRICEELDGLPLAIELAASLTRVLSLADLERQLDNRLGLLSERRWSGGRERSLAESVKWSIDLLEPDARSVLSRAVTFVGGFDVEAACAVCSGPGLDDRDVTRLLLTLADRSLLERVDADGVSTRYRMLETLREFGRGLLSDEELAAAQSAHADWAVQRARKLAALHLTEDEARAVRLFDHDFDNLRSAMRWALELGEVDVALSVSTQLHLLAFYRQRTELHTWLEEAIVRFADSQHELLPEAMGATADWRSMRGDAEGAADLERQIIAAEQSGQGLGLRALDALAGLAARRGDFAMADRHLARLAAVDEDGLQAALAAGDVGAMAFYAGQPTEARRRLSILIAEASESPIASGRAFAEIGTAVVLLSDDPDAALRRLESARALARSVGNRLVERIAVGNVAAIAARVHDQEQALATFGDVLAQWERDGVWRMEWATLQSFMELLGRLGRHEELLVLHAAGAASPTAPPLYGDQADRLAEAVASAERAVGAERSEHARSRGRAMSDAGAVAFARSIVRDVRQSRSDLGRG